MKFIRPLFSALATLGLLAGLLLVAPSAQAAAGSVSIAAPGYSHALDQWSRGSITTPKVSKSGKAKITSRSYVIIKGRSVVAKTSTAGKKVALSIGTYVVKVTVKYKVGKKKRTATKSFTIKIVNSPRMSYSEYKLIKTGMTDDDVAALVGGWGVVTDDSYYPGDCTFDENDDYVCTEVHEQRREFQTASAYGFAAVYFEDGLVSDGYNKYYSN